MQASNADFWSDHLRQVLERYDESLLRLVCDKLFKPRNQWPAAELIERCVSTVGNAAVIDRRLQGHAPAGRRLLAVIGHSQQPLWKLSSLMEVSATLDATADIRHVLALLEGGLLYPELPQSASRLRSFEQWLSHGAAGQPFVFAHPQVTIRALGDDLGLPECPGQTIATGGIHEADGLEWPLRLAVIWQQVAGGPLRRTQQGDFFKRDLDRLRADPILSSPPADHLAELPDAGLLAVELALLHGLLVERDGELLAAVPPPEPQEGIAAMLSALWSELPRLETWDPHQGWHNLSASGNPFASAGLLALLLLSRMPADSWADPNEVEGWILDHHPYWRRSDKSHSTQTVVAVPARRTVSGSLKTFLLGFAYQLRLLQAAKDADGEWVVRLSPLSRGLLGIGKAPAASPAYPQTLTVQPNLEIIVYRQGLNPGLIARLSQFAVWKNLGAACTLQLQPESVYRALESGQTFETIQQTLDRHGMRPTPTAVIESLRTWANKRERLSVYPAATLFEFASADDLNEALARGLPGIRVADRLAVVVDEAAIDFRHFRLTGTRDYGLQPEKCIDVADDGVTLTIDMSKSDLLLETELQRFAELSERGAANGRRQYRLTPASLAVVRDGGYGLQALEDWFLQRTGKMLSPAARLLLLGSRQPPVELRRQLVMHVSDSEIADGLMQWPQTRGLILARLGPTALAVADDKVDELRSRLLEVSVALRAE